MEKENSLLLKKSSDKNENTNFVEKTNRFNKITSKDYKSDENEQNHNRNQSKDAGRIRAEKGIKF